ncbi:MAG: hypothetical protein Q4F84_10910, partial [Fibrobacter sp.]|nr:hypothetical protein [Fibrobacter sp.]
MENTKVYNVVGIHITNRVKHVPQVQKVLTESGCYIKTRIGLHEVTNNTCSASGLIIVEFIGDDSKLKAFVDAL